MSNISQESADRKHFNIEIEDGRNSPSKVIRLSDGNAPLNVDPSSYDTMVIFQDLIKQQATEINRLTAELQRNEEQWMGSIKKLEEHYEARILFEAESAKETERRMEKMMKECEMKMDRMAKENSDLLLSLSLARKVLEDEENKFKEEKMVMMDKISQQEEQLKVQGHDLMQMRSYIGQSESTEKAQGEGFSMGDQSQKSLEEDVKLAESERKLLEEKLLITTELMKLQEDEMEQASGDPLEARKNLLSRWRGKVFELLVQLKFAEKFHSDEERKLNKKLQTANVDLESLQGRLHLSERSNNNKSEEIKVLSGKLKALQNELDSQNHRMDQWRGNEKNLKHFCSSFATSGRKHFENLERAATTVSKLHNRLKFVSYRVDAIKSQMNVRISHLEVENASLKSEILKCTRNHFGTTTTTRQRLGFVSPNDSTTAENKNSNVQKPADDKSKTSLVEEVKLLSSLILRDNL